MSHTTTDTDVSSAIARSRSHDEIVTILVGSLAEALAICEQLRAAAATDESTDWADANGVVEVWGLLPASDSDSMTWRVHVAYER